MDILLIIGVIVCLILGIINMHFYIKDKGKGNLYTAIFDFAVVLFTLYVMIFK